MLMGIPSYQLPTNFSASCQLTTIFFSQLLTFALKRKILHHNLNLLYFTEHANSFWGSDFTKTKI